MKDAENKTTIGAIIGSLVPMMEIEEKDLKYRNEVDEISIKMQAGWVDPVFAEQDNILPHNASIEQVAFVSSAGQLLSLIIASESDAYRWIHYGESKDARHSASVGALAQHFLCQHLILSMINGIMNASYCLSGLMRKPVRSDRLWSKGRYYTPGLVVQQGDDNRWPGADQVIKQITKDSRTNQEIVPILSALKKLKPILEEVAQERNETYHGYRPQGLAHRGFKMEPIWKPLEYNMGESISYPYEYDGDSDFIEKCNSLTLTIDGLIPALVDWLSEWERIMTTSPLPNDSEPEMTTEEFSQLRERTYQTYLRRKAAAEAAEQF